jgi:probable phosphoglycerate mutase
VIILARHGRTEFNEEGRYQGSRDSPLTALGLEQARRLGVLIGTLAPVEVMLWSSPLGRAEHTARIIKDIAGLDGEIVFDERLREVSLGSWDGLTDEEIESASPGACDGATRFDWFFRAPDGERYELVEARLASWLADVRQRPGFHVAVSHGLSGRILRGVYRAMPRTAVLKLDVPQDAVFRLHGGQCERIDAAA